MLSVATEVVSDACDSSPAAVPASTLDELVRGAGPEVGREPRTSSNRTSSIGRLRATTEFRDSTDGSSAAAPGLIKAAHHSSSMRISALPVIDRG
jgi:hypothetical protein